MMSPTPRPIMEHEAQSFDRRAFLLEMGAYDGVTMA